jgi:hypothetical protein
MAHGRPRDPRKEQQWRHWLEHWRHSGLSVRAFCERHHLTQASFYAWRRRLHLHAAATSFVPVQILADEPFAPPAALELVLNAGQRLRIRPGFDPATLRQVLAVLEGEPSC